MQAYSHEGRPVYVELVEFDHHYDLSWKIPPVITSGEEPIIELIGDGCKTISDTIGIALSGRKQYRCNNTERDKLRVKLNYPSGNPALSSLINYTNANDEQHSLFNSPEKLIIELPQNSTFINVAVQYVVSGVQHIAKGYDHLLFVLCLLFIARGWSNLIKTITGFTIGHSITLILASLNLFIISIELVESLIALSIVFLIVEIVRSEKMSDKSSLLWRQPILVATLCGLLHGFGFASVLSEFGLPQNMKATALIFFNVGVEIGQVLFVCLILLLFSQAKKLLQRSRQSRNRYSNSLSAVAYKLMNHRALIAFYPLGILSTYWFIERTTLIF